VLQFWTRMPKLWNFLPEHSKILKSQLLFSRGIKTSADKQRFFHPKISDYENLLKIPGQSQAKKRIVQALEKKETIFVYGDYDVDGVTASAVVYHGLKSLGALILPYIPHREKEGYGLSKIGLDEIKRQGGQLIITVDHGIVALEQALYAKELGLDLIITDHHTPLDKDRPEAVAIVHSIAMCGAAVAWSLVKDLIDDKLSHQLLQFVALGTIADMIPLTGLGRALVVEGLDELNTTTNVGLRALIQESGLTRGTLGAFEIGFVLAPRLNAIGRLEHAIDALRLLCTTSLLKATQLAHLLCDINSLRQRLTATAYEEARLQITMADKIHVLSSKSWQPGIIGLVAAKVCEDSRKPTIAISMGEEFSKGSARSIDGINITESIRQFSSLLIAFGGHAGAAGFTIETEKIAKFKKSLQDHFLTLQIADLGPSLTIEAKVDKKELTKETVFMLQAFEPFGNGNNRPVLATMNLQASDIRTVGEGKHLKLKLDGIDAIGFGMGEQIKDLQEGQVVDVAYYMEINSFNGRESLQLKLKDIKATI